MAKPPPVERFKIIAEVNVDQLGTTMAALTRLGIGDVHFELVELVKTFRQNHDAGMSQRLISEFIVDHPTFKAIDMVRHFEQHGNSRTSTYPAMQAAVKNHILKKTGPGAYARIDAKAKKVKKTKKTKPAKKAKVVKKAKGGKAFNGTASQNRYLISNGDFILKVARRGNGTVSSGRLKELFAKDGRFPSSVPPTLSELVNKGMMKRMGEGAYSLLARAKAEAPAVQATAAE